MCVESKKRGGLPDKGDREPEDGTGEGGDGRGLPAAKLQSPSCHLHYLTSHPHKAHHHIINQCAVCLNHFVLKGKYLCF